MHTLEQLRAGALQGARQLTLAQGLSEFPREIFELADTLEVLDLSGNALSALPEDLPRLKRLRILFASNNRFTTLPAMLGRCEQLEMIGFKANRIREVPAGSLPERLRWLILTDNEITALPATLGRCSRLQKLALAGNRLDHLPAEMAACRQLELLRLSANAFETLPDWLLHGLPRLSWLAIGGNPLNQARERAVLADSPLPCVDWQDLTLQEQLGQGASGTIHRACHGDEPVAVKVFKGEVTSDGWPDSEMAAAIHAGAHTGLIPAIARVVGHPSGAQALLMPLLDPARHRVLAGPPSLASCTRDVYGPDVRFEPPRNAARLAAGIAAAMAHLHRQGIAHGDLYAHNILTQPDGQAALGDFGAASLFDPQDASTATALQRIEARAFGCLLEELVERCPPDSAPAPMVALRDRCLDPDATQRPGFAQMAKALGDW